MSNTHEFMPTSIADGCALTGYGPFDASRIPPGLDVAVLNHANRAPLSISETLWKCPICLGIRRRPASLPCGHIGSESCCCGTSMRLLFWTVSIPRCGARPCPMCRAIYKKLGLLPYTSRPIPMRIMRQHVSVRFEDESCGLVGDPASASTHETHTCKKRLTGCPGCRYRCTLDDTYEQALQCKEVIVNCLRCCYRIRFVLRADYSCAEIICR